MILFILILHTMAIGYSDSIKESHMQLELVQVIFRHGARTPLKIMYDIFPYLDASVYEPYGWGELTNVGRRMEYNIGYLLHNRYSEFLNHRWRREDVYSFSSNTDRTKMSLQLVLAGLYPPTPNTTWDPLIRWHPIPYDYAPTNLDIYSYAQNDPTYKSLRKKAMASKEFKARAAKFDGLQKFLHNKTGVTCDDFLHTLAIYSVIDDNENMGLPIPDWYTPKVKFACIQYLELFYDSYALTNQLMKMAIGPLMKQYIHHMTMKNNPRKIYLYSAHDATLAQFVRALKIQNFTIPTFGSVGILEKWRDNNDKEYVKLLGWPGYGDIVFSLPLNGYKEYCPIDKFIELVEDIIPTNKEIDDIIASTMECSGDFLRKYFFNDPHVENRE